METGVRFIIAIVVAYLLGSINFAIIISKLTMKKDIRDFGSGNAGTTNALRVMGMKRAIFVVVGDVAKGIAAMLVCGYVVSFSGIMADIARAAAALACVLGHSFPIFFDFRGGKGVLTTAAVIGCIDWRICLIAVSIFLVIVIITRLVSLGSLIAVWTVPALFFVFGGGAEIVNIILGAVIAIFVTVLHRGNIARLAAGTENRLSFKK